MKKIYFLIAVFSSFCIASAQNKQDSLYKIWEDKTQSDSIRAKSYDDYIWGSYLRSQPDSALVFANRLYKFSTERAYKKGISMALNTLGVIHAIQGSYSKALDYYQRGLKISKENGDKVEEASFLHNIGGIYSNQEEYIKALEYYNESLAIKKEMGFKAGLAPTLNNIGVLYRNQGDYIKALEFFQRTLKILEEIGDQDGAVLANIGYIYMVQEDYINALDYYLRGLKFSEESNNKLLNAEILNGIGDLYFTQGDYLRAVEYCNKSLSISKKTKSIKRQNRSCECLYDAYKAMGNNKKALEYHEKMLMLTDSLKMEETSKKLQQMEFSKRILADSLIQVEKDINTEMTHKEETRKKDKNRNIAIGAGIFFLLLSSGFYSRWRYVKKSKAIIEKEKDRSENLLLNILPSEIAEELKVKGSADAKDFDLVSILFTDFLSFTETAEKLTAKELIGEINHCFKAFDHICDKFGIEKIKTIGDSYMAAGGLPIQSDNSIKNTVLAALEMQSFISNRIIEKKLNDEIPFEMRLGIHTGPVVAGIVGVKKFQYDIWGDTVNTASRMESNGEIGKVNISEDTYNHIKDDPQFSFENRGHIEAKGKGKIRMYFVR